MVFTWSRHFWMTPNKLCRNNKLIHSERWITSSTLHYINATLHHNNMYIGVSGQSGPKKTIKEKFTLFTKVLNYVKSSCIIFYIKMSQYSQYTYCLQKESTHCGLRVSTHFGLEVLVQFGMENHKRKVSNNLKTFFNYTNFSWIVFYTKLSQYPKYLPLD